jgi:hypothetical protein
MSSLAKRKGAHEYFIEIELMAQPGLSAKASHCLRSNSPRREPLSAQSFSTPIQLPPSVADSIRGSVSTTQCRVYARGHNCVSLIDNSGTIQGSYLNRVGHEGRCSRLAAESQVSTDGQLP